MWALALPVLPPPIPLMLTDDTADTSDMVEKEVLALVSCSTRSRVEEREPWYSRRNLWSFWEKETSSKKKLEKNTIIKPRYNLHQRKRKKQLMVVLSKRIIIKKKHHNQTTIQHQRKGITCGCSGQRKPYN